MFTGIIEDIGTLDEIQRSQEAMALKILTRLPEAEVGLGDSIAVNGVCLTVTEKGPGWFQADVSHETLAATSLGHKDKGDRVHLERALAMGGRLGGHLVSGHVDGLGEVVDRRTRGQTLDIQIVAPDEVAAYLVAKGSVTVDGVSLTVNQPAGVRFGITLVPHTLGQTILGELRPGHKVNLEADILGKYIEHFLARSASGGVGKIDEAFLAEHGFGGRGSTGSSGS